MKLFPLALFLLAFSFLYSQEKPTFGIEMQPKLVTFNHNNRARVSEDVKAGFSIAGNVYFKTSTNLSFKTGLSIHTYQMNLRDNSPIFSCDFLVNPSGSSYYTFELPLNYLGIPTYVKWDLSEKERRFYANIGLETLLRLASKGSHKVYECSENTISAEGTLSGLSPFLVIAGIGMGYEIPINKNVKIYLEPKIEYSLNKVFEDDQPILLENDIETNGYFGNIGLTAGILF